MLLDNVMPEFVAFEEPGYMKGAMNFRVEPVDAGTELRTETRVLTTDPASRRAFRRYWLRAARRRAEVDALSSGGRFSFPGRSGSGEDTGSGPGRRDHSMGASRTFWSRSPG